MIRRLINLPNRIPRPAKVIFCAVCVVLLTILYYIALGVPTLTFEQEFRRAEKANLIGPSKIVDVVGGIYDEFDKMIVGETEHGICFFGGEKIDISRGSNFTREEMMYTFSYREKTGDITVIAAPNRVAHFWGIFGISLPVYVFDDYPEAVRAELELTITGTETRFVNNETVTTSFSEQFFAEADRTAEGFFRFLLNDQGTPRAHALKLLSRLSGNEMYNTDENIHTVVPGIVRLYDADGKLILEREFEICSAVAAAHK